MWETMWFRPDAITVWRDPEVVRRLSWYRSVMLDEKPAKFVICKHVGLDEDPSCLKEMEEPELWSLHDRLARDFREAHRGIREGTLSLEELGRPELDFLKLKAELAERILRSCRFCVRRSAHLLFPNLKSGSQMSTTSTSNFMASGPQRILLFHSIGTFTFKRTRLASMTCRLGVGSPPTRFMLAAPSRLSVASMAASLRSSTTTPFSG